MKKQLIAVLIIIGIIFTGCQTQTTETTQEEESVQLVIGATPVPHAELLEVAKEILAEKNIELVIREFTDYVTPNMALDEGQLDANFFQHLPYMENFAMNNNIELLSVASVHIEPMGLYSRTLESIDELQEGATIAIPNDATNEGRALLLLQAEGLITLEDEEGFTQTPVNIVDNPKNLSFIELEAAQLPRVLIDVDAAVINTNFALEGGLNPMEDALFIEDKDTPYGNILVVRPEDEDNEAIQELVKALKSEAIKAFIDENYQDAIIPAF
ncbi:D-methionine transport system substrate-binding protein [Natranaerovirga hydrolytica]|uniref:Lipoprotein n=1 Tax=Natranaerovirga hydrolytica TaxID=680378 RepID=A0A4R1MPR0_9FIRM|nr:MetQ/NlpA family ABC transporter substrate-binding protein [Natranaerovirga hydrolytica]TCK92489.1 D-methionine transport system substrate-binding protein [Natranaerovirga hydrolytica]